MLSAQHSSNVEFEFKDFNAHSMDCLLTVAKTIFLKANISYMNETFGIEMDEL